LQFCEICGYIKIYGNKFFSPLSFVAVLGSGIWDNIPDPPHCLPEAEPSGKYAKISPLEGVQSVFFLVCGAC
jgi:hypothetical protein